MKTIITVWVILPMLCFFVSVRGGVYPPTKLIEKDGSYMQEPYKDMYIHLHKHMEILESIFEKLTMIIGNSLTDSTDMLLTDLNEQAKNKTDINKQFADLFKSTP